MTGYGPLKVNPAVIKCPLFQASLDLSLAHIHSCLILVTLRFYLDCFVVSDLLRAYLNRYTL